MHRRRFRFRPGFSLIELLVVIGIIAVLIGILLPALSRARAASQQSVCLSNLRQLSMACYMYAVDCQGLACPSTVTGTTGVDTLNGITGFAYYSWNYEQVQQQASPNASAFSFAQGYLGKYLKTDKVLECPAMTAYDLPANVVGQPLTSYAMAVVFAVKFSQIRIATDTVLFGDAISIDPSTGLLSRPVQFTRPSQTTNWPAYGANDSFMGRHLNGNGGVGFCDGHAEMIPARVRHMSTYSGMTPDRWTQVQALHIGPCIPPTLPIDYSICTNRSSYATACYNTYDYYFWANKTYKQ